MARQRLDRYRALGIGALAVAVVGIALVAVRALPPKSQAKSSSAVVLRVPHATARLTLDGEVEDWRGPHAQTGMFKSVDGQSTPDSEAHLLWGDGKLYLLLYAADQDIRASVKTPDAPLWPEDAFKLTFQRPGDDVTRVIYVSPNGTLTDESVAGERVDTSWQSGAEVAHEFDGTPNDASDEDEEWIVELAIPLSALGLRGEAGERVDFSLRRCDVPKGAGRRCAAWGEPDGALIFE